MEQVESPTLLTWKDLRPDKAFLESYLKVVLEAFEVLAKRRAEFWNRVEMVKIEVAKERKFFSGRSPYWMILHELRQSCNAIGLKQFCILQRLT